LCIAFTSCLQETTTNHSFCENPNQLDKLRKSKDQKNVPQSTAPPTKPIPSEKTAEKT